MPPEALAIMLGEMGITNATTVIIYADEVDYRAPYLFWALDYIGHESMSILEGGFGKWQLEGRRVTKKYPAIEPVTYELPEKLREEVRATLDQVKEAIKRPDAVLIDVRPPDLYSGEKGFWKRNGHIQGAINRFWHEDLKEDGFWKDRIQLAGEYEELGVIPETNIIVSCGQGQMSALTYFTLKYILAYPNVANYDGGFSEWSVIPDLPVETGP
jgi:thiosulfate/3-mercaptopyruvate sulfurtransferase